VRVKTIFLIECFKEEIQYDLFLLLLGMCTFKYQNKPSLDLTLRASKLMNKDISSVKL